MGCLSGGPFQRLAVASASSCLHLTCFLRREQFTFWECSQVLERLNIERVCGQGKSSLVCLKELKEGKEGGHLKALSML